MHPNRKSAFMTISLKAFAPALFLLPLFFLSTEKEAFPLKENSSAGKASVINPPVAMKIQAAILLDVSNSMDGLIEQAKSQLWNMVSIMGKAKCNGSTPGIEIALYEYGTPRNAAATGYVKQLSPFTTDLDGLSKTLFGLKTNGGDEYCGQVIHTAVNELAWDTSAASYKVIFIAGNENFLQGKLQYTQACTAAKSKGILVNTIYCGDKQQGIREHWNLGGECGGGDYTSINQDAKEEEIPTPYDSTLMVLNTRLNKTYIGYGNGAAAGLSTQAYADVSYFQANKSVAMKRIAVKSNKKLYNNAAWDLVDAADKDGDGVVDKLDKELLPDSVKKLSAPQLKQYVKTKSAERAAVQTEIANVSLQRENYITEERKKKATANRQQTLETETEKLLKKQAKQFNMLIE